MILPDDRSRHVKNYPVTPPSQMSLCIFLPDKAKNTTKKRSFCVSDNHPHTLGINKSHPTTISKDTQPNTTTIRRKKSHEQRHLYRQRFSHDQGRIRHGERTPGHTAQHCRYDQARLHARLRLCPPTQTHPQPPQNIIIMWRVHWSRGHFSTCHLSSVTTHDPQQWWRYGERLASDGTGVESHV